MQKQKKPNFLLVGASKSGSTTLWRYLNDHPMIFMSRRKEPQFFVSEAVTKNTRDKWMRKFMEDTRKKNIKPVVDTFEEYLELFNDVTHETAIGEASTPYLYYHQKSIPKIKSLLGDVKILIILRNPVKKVFSQYKYLKRGGAEPLSFYSGIKKEQKRKAMHFNSLYHYVSQGLYYDQVKDFYDNFTCVKVVLLEDLISDTEAVMKSVFTFLDVDSSHQLSLKNKAFNQTGYIAKSKSMNQALNTSIMKKVRHIIFIISPGLYNRLVNSFINLNTYTPKITEREKNLLMESFKGDIIKLEKLLDRNLDIWKRF